MSLPVYPGPIASAFMRRLRLSRQPLVQRVGLLSCTSLFAATALTFHPAVATETTAAHPLLTEVDSGPVDWIELHNDRSEPIDISGFVVTDNAPTDPTHRYTIPTGTTIAPGKYLQIKDLPFGLGKADSVLIFAPGETAFTPDNAVQRFDWTEHPAINGNEAEAAYSRLPDGTFAVRPITPGTANVTEDVTNNKTPEQQLAAALAAGAIDFPGDQDTRVIDTEAMFLADSSGLDATIVNGQQILWLVDNNAGTIFKTLVAADGSVTVDPAWVGGKAVRFLADADRSEAAGPDAEGLTVGPAGDLFLAIERDNSAKKVNKNVIMQVTVTDDTPRNVREWDITDSLGDLDPNTGLEAIEWVSDEDLKGKVLATSTATSGIATRSATGAAYNPADYPGKLPGLFFVGVENTANVHAYALYDDGRATQVATIHTGLGGVMSLDWDTTTSTMLALCDNGCEGLGVRIALTPQAPALQAFRRPTGLPDLNNEGFASSPLCVDGKRFVWWIADGETTNSLRVGRMNCTAVPTNPTGSGSSGSVGSTKQLEQALRTLVPLGAGAVVAGAIATAVGSNAAPAAAPAAAPLASPTPEQQAPAAPAAATTPAPAEAPAATAIAATSTPSATAARDGRRLANTGVASLPLAGIGLVTILVGAALWSRRRNA